MCYGFPGRNIMRVSLDLKGDDVLMDVSLLEKFVTYLARKPFLENKIILCRSRYVFYNLLVIFPFNFYTNVVDL